MKNYLKIGILLLGISLLLWNCEKEDSLQKQQTIFETVSVNEAISFFDLKKASSKAKSNTENYVTPNLNDITQEEIINSSELLTIVSASTIYEKHYSRILFLKINQEIRSVVFSMYPSKNSKSGKFSGEIMITDLNGDFLNGYRVFEGELKTQFKLKNTGNKNSVSYKSSSDVCPDHGECTEGSYCVFCNQVLEEVVVISNSGGSGNSVPITGLYNYEGVDQGGSSGPDTGMSWDYGSGGGGAPNNFVFNEDEMIFDEGDRPLEEFDNKCTGVNRIWQLSQANGDEYAAVLTSDGAILITQQLNPNGGGISGIYNHNGNTYYQYPASQGSPTRTYAGQLYASGRYFIPIIATIHSHTPSINDGTDGITNNIINDDQAFANHYPNINHYIIGCNAIGQFNSSSNQAFNINKGNLSSICNIIN